MTSIEASGLLTFTISILVFFAGNGINRMIPFLRDFNIPEAVTGGLLASLATLVFFKVLDIEIVFDLDARDMLLLYFFTGIGLNARLGDLIAGGRPLLVLLALTLVYLVIQNVIAAGSVSLMGLPEGLTVFLGSASLIGGHGTTIAWAPIISERFGISSAMEVGIATATLGLVIASLAGGPIAHNLLRRYKLEGSQNQIDVVGLPTEPENREQEDVSHISLLRTILVLNIAVMIGFGVNELISDLPLKLPLFVICLLVGIVMTNTVPHVLPNLRWPTRTRALALVSDFSLNVFLSMSLMSMQLWTLGELGIALLIVLAIQTLAAVLYIFFIVFPAMGRNYEAAVISAGFTGISLGATPTAIANMTAVTKLHGAAPRAFIILPLVSAFFVDIANAAVIGFLAN